MTFDELMASMQVDTTPISFTPSAPVKAEGKNEYELTLSSAEDIAEKICDGEVVDEVVAVNVFRSLATLYKKKQ